MSTNPTLNQLTEDAAPAVATPVAPYMVTSHGAVAFHQEQLPGLPAFLAGNPEAIVMTDKPKVIITWMHTNEPHAPSVAHELYTQHPELAKHVNYICGNPLTARTAPEKGFTDNDLNRNFLPEILASPRTYEERRAVEVMKFIDNTEYVLDLHNTVCTNFGKLIIIRESMLEAPAIRRIIAASPIKRILLMGPSVAKGSLIDEPKERTITIEYEIDKTQSQGVPDSIATIRSLVDDEIPEPVEREVFRAVGPIPKSEDPGLHVKNFEPFTDKNGGTRYAAFLGTGPRSYREDKTKDYCGFYVTMERMVL